MSTAIITERILADIRAGDAAAAKAAQDASMHRWRQRAGAARKAARLDFNLLLDSDDLLKQLEAFAAEVPSLVRDVRALHDESRRSW